MKISLVTGGAGFIGAHVTNHLIKFGHKVIVIDDLSGGFIENINKNAIFIKGTILDKELLENLFNEYKFDYVFHLAAYAAEGLSHFIRNFNYQNNLIGSINLINLSVLHKIKCFVFTSSIAVYGEGQLPMREELTPTPEDPYGVSKYAVELDLKCAKEMFNLDYVIFRPHNVYGEFQNIGDRYRNVIGIFMNQLLKGESLTIFGDGNQTRAFSYIDDVAPHIANSINIKSAYNKIFNIGGDIDYSVNELAKTTMEVMGLSQDINYQPARNEVLHAYADHTNAKKIFNLNEDNFINLREGIEKMAGWVSKVGSRESNYFGEIEIHEKLPPIWLDQTK
jgi:UDP-glucose 4-epimerase